MRVSMLLDRGTHAKVNLLQIVRISRIDWTRESGQAR